MPIKKIPVTTSGIEPVTFQLVVHCLIYIYMHIHKHMTIYDHKTNDYIRRKLRITGILDKIDE